MVGAGKEGRNLPPPSSAGIEREPEIRVLIVEDHLLLAESMASVLRDNGVDVVAIAQSGREAVSVAAEALPNVVLMDIGLPDMDGIDAGREIMKRLPETKLLAITGLDSADIVREVMLNGFHGYLHKNAQSAELIESIHLVASGQAVLPQKAVQRLATRATEEVPSSGAAASRLTGRELEVLALLVEGADTGRVAQRLFLSTNTVRTHIQNILGKLQVHSRLEAATYAVRHGIVKPPNRQRDRQ